MKGWLRIDVNDGADTPDQIGVIQSSGEGLSMLDQIGLMRIQLLRLERKIVFELEESERVQAAAMNLMDAKTPERKM